MPFEVPNGWVWCTLEDLAFYKKGPFGSSLTKSMFVPESDNAFKVYEQKNAIGKDETLGTYYISKEKFEELKGFEVQPNDIIVSCAGTIGETYVLPETIRRGIINQALMLVRLYDKDISAFYLLYFDYILKKQAAKESKGTAIKNIPPFDVLKSFLFPLPPLLEQQRIITEVNKWFNYIVDIENNIDELNNIITRTKNKILDLAIRGKLVEQDKNDEPASELLKRINPDWQPSDTSHYEQLPKGWEFARLADLCTFLSRGKSPKYSDERLYPVFAQKCNLKDGGISLDKAQFLDPETLVKWPADYKLRTGDILINSTGTGTVGRTRLFDESVLGHYPFVVPDSHVSVVRTFDTISSEYIFAVISSIRYQKYIEDNLAGSTNQKELYIGVLEDMVIPLPPLPEQERITAKIKSLFNTLDSISQSLTD